MNSVSILDDHPHWRSRKVYYTRGDWDDIIASIPTFELVPFTAGSKDTENPLLRTVARQPRTPTGRLMPVGIVSHNYSLIQHHTIMMLCRSAITAAGVDDSTLQYEVGLSEHGEWMNFRAYFPEEYGFVESSGSKMDLKLECFNSVDRTSRIKILFGWYRKVCSNGLIIGDTRLEIKERHEAGLNLKKVAKRVQSALRAVESDRRKMKKWESELVRIDDIELWVNDLVSREWGRKAAARVFHICESGMDIEFSNPFARGEATEKPIRYTDRVPGSPDRASTKFDVSLALSFVASHRRNVEECVLGQAGIARMLEQLTTTDFVARG